MSTVTMTATMKTLQEFREWFSGQRLNDLDVMALAEMTDMDLERVHDLALAGVHAIGLDLEEFQNGQNQRGKDWVRRARYALKANARLVARTKREMSRRRHAPEDKLARAFMTEAKNVLIQQVYDDLVKLARLGLDDGSAE